MRLYTKSFNMKSDLEDFVNEQKIERENIVSIFPEGGQFVLFYYGE